MASSYYAPHKPVQPPKAKSPTRIEVWRQEVSSSLSSSSSSSMSHSIEGPEEPPSNTERRMSFWKRIIKREGSGKGESEEEAARTSMYFERKEGEVAGDEGCEAWLGSSMENESVRSLELRGRKGAYLHSAPSGKKVKFGKSR